MAQSHLELPLHLRNRKDGAPLLMIDCHAEATDHAHAALVSVAFAFAFASLAAAFPSSALQHAVDVEEEEPAGAVAVLSKHDGRADHEQRRGLADSLSRHGQVAQVRRECGGVGRVRVGHLALERHQLQGGHPLLLAQGVRVERRPRRLVEQSQLITLLIARRALERRHRHVVRFGVRRVWVLGLRRRIGQ